MATTDEQQRGTIAATLRHWRQDPDLAGLRNPGAPGLAELPDDERAAFTQFRADEPALLDRPKAARAYENET